MKLRGLRIAAAGLVAGGLVWSGLAYGGSAIADGGGSAPPPPIDMLPAYSGSVIFNPPPRPCLDPCGADVVVVDDLLVDPALDRMRIPESLIDGAGSGAQPQAVQGQ